MIYTKIASWMEGFAVKRQGKSGLFRIKVVGRRWRRYEANVSAEPAPEREESWIPCPDEDQSWSKCVEAAAEQREKGAFSLEVKGKSETNAAVAAPDGLSMDI